MTAPTMLAWHIRPVAMEFLSRVNAPRSHLLIGDGTSIIAEVEAGTAAIMVNIRKANQTRENFEVAKR